MRIEPQFGPMPVRRIKPSQSGWPSRVGLGDSANSRPSTRSDGTACSAVKAWCWVALDLCRLQARSQVRISQLRNGEAEVHERTVAWDDGVGRTDLGEQPPQAAGNSNG